jgi:hypothetical protein
MHRDACVCARACGGGEARDLQDEPKAPAKVRVEKAEFVEEPLSEADSILRHRLRFEIAGYALGEGADPGGKNAEKPELRQRSSADL